MKRSFIIIFLLLIVFHVDHTMAAQAPVERQAPRWQKPESLLDILPSELRAPITEYGFYDDLLFWAMRQQLQVNANQYVGMKIDAFRPHVIVSKNGEILADANGSIIATWNNKGKLLYKWPAPISLWDQVPQSFSISPDGKIIVGFCTDSTVKIWTFKGDLIASLDIFFDIFSGWNVMQYSVPRVLFNENSTKILINQDRVYDYARIILFDITTQQIKKVDIPIAPDSTSHVALSPDGNFFTCVHHLDNSRSQVLIDLYNFNTTEKLKTIQRKEYRNLFFYDNKTLIADSPNGIRLIDIESENEQVISEKGHWDALSDDGKKLIYSFQESAYPFTQSIYAYDFLKKTTHQLLIQDFVSAAKFGPNNIYLVQIRRQVVPANDKQYLIKIFDEQNKLLTHVEGSYATLKQLAFNKDASILIVNNLMYTLYDPAFLIKLRQLGPISAALLHKIRQSILNKKIFPLYKYPESIKEYLRWPQEVKNMVEGYIDLQAPIMPPFKPSLKRAAENVHLVSEAFNYEDRPLAILFNPTDANQAKENWKKMIQVWHPDRNRDMQEYANAVTQAINNAYESLIKQRPFNPGLLQQTAPASLDRIEQNYKLMIEKIRFSNEF